MTYREIYEVIIWLIFIIMASVVALYLIWTIRREK